MLDGDQEFLRQAGERMEGYFPGMSERIDKLSAEQLGRGIVIERYKADPTSQSRDELVGYILPVDATKREHIILFKSGDIFVISPRTLGSGAKSTQADMDRYYGDVTNPSPVPVELSAISYPTIERVVGSSSFTRDRLAANINMRNNDPTNVQNVLAKVDQAVSFAKGAKVEKDKAKEYSANQSMTRIDELLNPKSSGGPQPPLPPPTSSQ